ncbi:MAG: ABC transporter ATP-binding protein [Acidobacteriota bacterium]
MKLALRGIHHDYGRGPVLAGVSCEVPQKDFLAVVGPNGAGKSTLLRVAAALLEPTEGEVRLDGRLIRDLSRTEVAQRVALVPQESSMAFPFSVLDIVLMGRHPHLAAWQIESRADREAARQALSRVGLEGFESRRFYELSGGEKQRVILARAIAQGAPLLLLDEPTAYLDLRHQVGIYDILSDLNAAGTTIVAVTHDINLVSAYCRHALALRAGSVCAYGAPGEVLRREILEEVYGVPLRAIPQGEGLPPFIAPVGRRSAVSGGKA